MTARLYVGNLAYSTMEHQLRDAFAAHGQVVSASVVIDRMSGQSRGFGFVEFAEEEDASRAVEAMDGFTLDGRALRVSPARELQGSGGGRGGGGARQGGGHKSRDGW